MKREKARIQELRNMPYDEYLHTPEWQETQKATLLRAKNQCQGCKAGNVTLSVYHTTYDNLGCEQEDDLVALCEACSDHLVHSMKLAESHVVPAELDEEKTYPDFSFKAKAAVFAPAAVVGLGLPVLLHAPLPAEIFGLVAALALAANSPKIYAEVRSSLPAPLVELIDGMVERKRARAEKREWNTWDRLIGRHLHGNPSNEEQEQISPEKDEREATPAQRRQPEQRAVSNEDDDLPLPPSVARSGAFVFSSVLSHFTPTLERVYLATTMDGLELFCPAEHLCHVALGGSTDSGKSSIMRLLMAQLCKAGAQVLLLNPHYTRYDIKKKEDWTPFEPYLMYAPMECRKYDVIEHYLRYTAETLLPRRLEKYAHSQPTGKPYFLVLDELPSIIKRIPKATGYLGELLREGRKVGIFLISASQDFLVKTIAPDGSGGAVRDCYRTAYYVGGDATTAKTLLDIEARKIPEDQLGHGFVMLRCARAPEAKKALLVRVPYVDNEALYRLLGPSTYKPTRVHPQAPETLLLPPPSGVSTTQHQANQMQGREHPRKSSESLAGQRRPDASLPKVLRDALVVYEPGMTYWELGTALGYGRREARELFIELKKRGLLHGGAQQAGEHGAAKSSSSVPSTHNQQQSRRLYPVPSREDEEAEPETASLSASSASSSLPQISQADLARAYAYYEKGHTSYRKLYDVAYPAHGWSEKKCRALISAMEGQGLIQTKRRGQG